MTFRDRSGTSWSRNDMNTIDQWNNGRLGGLEYRMRLYCGLRLLWTKGKDYWRVRQKGCDGPKDQGNDDDSVRWSKGDGDWETWVVDYDDARLGLKTVDDDLSDRERPNRSRRRWRKRLLRRWQCLEHSKMPKACRSSLLEVQLLSARSADPLWRCWRRCSSISSSTVRQGIADASRFELHLITRECTVNWTTVRVCDIRATVYVHNPIKSCLDG